MQKLGQNSIEDIYKSVLRFLEPLTLDETYKRVVGEAVRLVKGASGSFFERGTQKGYKSRQSLHIPLSYQNEPIGVLIVSPKKDNKFSPKDREVLKLFASMASLAIKKAQLDEGTKRLSHELRTPLTTISGYVQLLQSKIKPENGVPKIWIDELSKEVSRLTLLIKELFSP